MKEERNSMIKDDGATKKIIPYTELRTFYKMLRSYSSTGFHCAFAEEIARAKNTQKLADQFCRSVKHFESYENRDEKFYDGANRKKLESSCDKITSTLDAAVQINKTECTVRGKDELNFLYVDREIVPARTKGGAFEYHESSSHNRSADLLLKNAKDNRPIIGEIKVKADANPFLALIQLLLHAAEMVTQNQVQRLKNSYPDEDFQTEKDDCPGYDLYLVMFGYEKHLSSNNKSSVKLWEDLLKYTETISQDLVKCKNFRKYVRRIVCLNLPEGESVDQGFKLGKEMLD